VKLEREAQEPENQNTQAGPSTAVEPQEPAAAPAPRTRRTTGKTAAAANRKGKAKSNENINLVPSLSRPQSSGPKRKRSPDVDGEEEEQDINNPAYERPSRKTRIQPNRGGNTARANMDVVQPQLQTYPRPQIQGPPLPGLLPNPLYHGQQHVPNTALYDPRGRAQPQHAQGAQYFGLLPAYPHPGGQPNPQLESGMQMIQNHEIQGNQIPPRRSQNPRFNGSNIFNDDLNGQLHWGNSGGSNY